MRKPSSAKAAMSQGCAMRPISITMGRVATSPAVTTFPARPKPTSLNASGKPLVSGTCVYGTIPTRTKDAAS
eukprot:CAMPEP_0113306504 /NCGR_PEP_ID=MMETSP0010_2-20120614/5728_1 /TAXON_ID=216773 ORGANISM="Corethron hystrix, Strain 308" /NCGR_SAMPLE_ID=MMETSP0010_2 /ASSEMBLY_ACC=CAM_ASM_000155 /LENGTH=71 /DNA_ID=CAMNT_0000161183 /DNA_START=334 /DNA_END=549 /DNA_ORIENTATION=+ /assembly_acc=CAM_ASM_000155